MFQKIILLILFQTIIASIRLDYSAHCKCSLLNQLDCYAQDYWCAWNSLNKSCQVRSLNQGCRYYKWQESCRSNPDRCYFLANYHQCVKTSCFDSIDQQSCVAIGCLWNSNNSTCTEDQTKCSEIPRGQECTAFYCATYLQQVKGAACVIVHAASAGADCRGGDYKSCRQWKDCRWDYQLFSCSSQLYKGCQGYTDQNNCKTHNCQWTGSNCQNTITECSQLTAESCNDYEIIQYNTIIKCTYQNGECVEKDNFDDLNKNTCNFQTYHNFQWRNSKCIACPILENNDNAPLISSDGSTTENTDNGEIYDGDSTTWSGSLLFIIWTCNLIFY